MTATLPITMPSTGPGQSARKSVDREELSGASSAPRARLL